MSAAICMCLTVVIWSLAVRALKSGDIGLIFAAILLPVVIVLWYLEHGAF